MKVSGLVFLVIWVTCVSGARPCPENCLVIQNPLLPECNKDTGTCSRGCITGYFGDKCNMMCDVNCQHGTCQQRDGSCTCEPGYSFHNGSCYPQTGVKCKSNDHCLNNTCVSANRRDCLEGCSPGWFGKFCQQPCSPHCVCNEVTGNCNSCITGWYGAECGSHCSPGCMDKECDRNWTCVNNCNIGYYGIACDQKCSQHCVSDCDQLSGDCIKCEAGLYGPTCQSECSAGCAGSNRDCQRDGRCSRDCRRGFYGEKCDSCPQQCFGDLCDDHGTCSACNNGFFGTSCHELCLRCNGGVCHQTTGECIRGCDSGFYGALCNLTCGDCTSGDCDKASGECRHKDDMGNQFSSVQFWIGGGVAVVILIIIAVGVYMSRRLKRIQGVVYDNVKWRRRPPSAIQDVRPGAAQGYLELEEQETITPRRVCPSVPIRKNPSYIEPRHSGYFGNLQIQPQLQADGVSGQQQDELQGAAAPSGGLLQRVQRRSEEWSERPDSYSLPHYCEVDEGLMAILPEPALGAQAPTSTVNTPVFSIEVDVHGTRGDIRIPPIAECFGPTGTDKSSPDLQPLVENYDHLKRGAVASSDTVDDEVRISLARLVQLNTARPDDYIEPPHGDCLVASQQQMLPAGVSDQQEGEPQALGAPPSDRLLHDVQIAKVLQHAQKSDASGQLANNSSFPVVADLQSNRRDISIPLLAECFGPTETGDSSPDEDSNQLVENYDHIFRVG